MAGGSEEAARITGGVESKNRPNPKLPGTCGAPAGEQHAGAKIPAHCKCDLGTKMPAPSADAGKSGLNSNELL